MNKIQHYVQGQWTTGKEEGTPILDAITGEAFTSVATEGLDIPEILNYGRTKGGEVLRKMTFQERGNMLKKLALYLTKRKDAFYELSFRTGATKVDSWIDIEGVLEISLLMRHYGNYFQINRITWKVML